MAGNGQTDSGGKTGGDQKVDPAIQRLQIYVGLVKFLIGTVALGAITLFVNEQYRRAQLDLEKEKSRHAIELQERKAEVEYLSKFVQNAMDKDIALRVDFADYMKSVALSETLQKIWSKYYDVLIKKADEAAKQIKTLEAEKQATASKLAAAEFARKGEETTKQFLEQLQDIDRNLYRIQDELDRRRYGSFQQNFFDYQAIADQADAAERAGSYERERDILLDAVKRVPQAVLPYFLGRLASAYRSLHDFANADRVMMEAVKLAPSADSLFRLAIMQKNDNQLDLALQTLAEAAKRAQDEAFRTQIELVTAGYLIHKGQREEGLKRFEALQPRLQPSEYFIGNIAWFNAVADRKAEFYKAFEAALKVRPQETLVWVDQEVDINKYRNEERFKQLVSDARAGRG